MPEKMTTSHTVLRNPVTVGDQFFYLDNNWVVAQTERIGTALLVAAAACEYCPKGVRLPRNTRYRIFRCMEEYDV